MSIDLAMPILVVDDYRAMLQITCELLEQLGFLDVDEAQAVEAALEMARGQTYKLIICDWLMKPLTGLDLLRVVRVAPGGARTRFLMVSAEAKRDRIAAARCAGADAYLVKPFRAPALKSAIDEIFGA
jgi:two-component system, chemotaxis family, chemotaxis protein CheY